MTLLGHVRAIPEGLRYAAEKMPAGRKARFAASAARAARGKVAKGRRGAAIASKTPSGAGQ